MCGDVLVPCRFGYVMPGDSVCGRHMHACISCSGRSSIMMLKHQGPHIRRAHTLKGPHPRGVPNKTSGCEKNLMSNKYILSKYVDFGGESMKSWKILLLLLLLLLIKLKPAAQAQVWPVCVCVCIYSYNNYIVVINYYVSFYKVK